MKLRTLTLSTLKMLVATALLAAVHEAHADVVVSERTVEVPVEINAETVKRSSAGYSAPMVKILIPALADVTLLNHRNFPESAPCLAAPNTASIHEVIQDRPASETAQLTLQLRRDARLQGETCSVWLIEKINGLIREQAFTHTRISQLQSRVAADCR